MNCEARSLNEYRIIEEEFESQTIRNNNPAPSHSDINSTNNTSHSDINSTNNIGKGDAIHEI